MGTWENYTEFIPMKMYSGGKCSSPAFMLKRLCNPTEREIGFLFILAAVMVVFIPVLQTRGVPEEKRVELEDKARATITQIIAASSVGLYFAFRNIRATERNVDLAERRLHSERFTEATRLLSSGDVFTQIAGVYAIGQLAEVSRDFYGQSLNILLAYLRHCSHLESDSLNTLRETDIRAVSPIFPEPEAEAAIQILGVLWSQREALNFTESSLIQGRLDLSQLRLGSTQFISFNFNRASFVGSVLAGAVIKHSKFLKADFKAAILSCAQVEDTDFEEADFLCADFRRANLGNANVKGAKFFQARLHGASLKDVQGLVNEQIAHADGDANTILPDGVERPAHWSLEPVDYYDLDYRMGKDTQDFDGQNPFQSPSAPSKGFISWSK